MATGMRFFFPVAVSRAMDMHATNSFAELPKPVVHERRPCQKTYSFCNIRGHVQISGVDPTIEKGPD